MTLSSDDQRGASLPPFHLTDEDFALFICDAFSAEDLTRVSRHLGSCQDCRNALAKIRSAITADAANPERFDRLVEMLSVMPVHVGAVSVVGVKREDVAARLQSRLSDIGCRISGLVQTWAGDLGDWTSQLPVSDGALANGVAGTKQVGVEAGLESLFETSLLRGALSWAAGPLRISAIQEEGGTLRSLRAVVGRSSASDPEGGAIVLELSDARETIALTLSRAHPSAVARVSSLTGWNDLHLRIYAEGENHA